MAQLRFSSIYFGDSKENFTLLFVCMNEECEHYKLVKLN